MSKAFQTVEDWIQQRIPTLLGSPLTAAFVSYNAVGDFRPGTQETGKTGLQVVVQNGYAETSVALPFLRVANIKTAMFGARLMNVEASRGQHIAETELCESFSSMELGQHILLVVYAGLSGFEESIDFVRSFRCANNPQSTIAVLTCDCGLWRKQETLFPLHENGTINDVIVTRYCGGEGQMGEMLHALIDSWPTAPTA